MKLCVNCNIFHEICRLKECLGNGEFGTVQRGEHQLCHTVAVIIIVIMTCIPIMIIDS